MESEVVVRVDGREVRVPSGTSVAAAVARAGAAPFWRSTSGQPRAPLCGMGICFECRVSIGGRSHVRSCTLPCEAGMEIRTAGTEEALADAG